MPARAHPKAKSPIWPLLPLAVLCLLLALGPQNAQGQQAGAGQPLRLIADALEIVDGDTLRASGQVEVFSQDMRLNAAQVTYNRRTGQLRVQGPLIFDDGTSVVVLGSEAELSDDLRQGLVRTAKLILSQELEMTAAIMQRVDGRYNVLRRAKASSCQTCAGGPPLWEIRASKVVHDIEAQQIYFNDAQFRMGGVPVFYLPRLRLADATMTRGSGFLVPRFELTKTWGYTVKTPYFQTLGPHRDLLITPIYTNTGARTLDLRYRQAFAKGTITANAIWAQDNPAAELRKYFKIQGNFSLPRDYTLSFSGETVSGSGYFAGYGLNEKDRFVTTLSVARVNRAQLIQARVLGFYSVRAGDDNATQPSQIADFERLDRIDLGQAGELRLGVQANTRLRASSSDVDGADSDTAADGRDVRGFGLRAAWHKGAVLPMGVLADVTLALRSDDYRVDQDAVYAGLYQRRHAAFGAQLRWPLIKTTQAAGGRRGVHVLEPTAQLVLAPPQTERLFNDDSALVDFDEGNLFALNRFPGSDRIEHGARANLGVNYSYAAPGGQRLKLALGRVISAQSTSQFAAASGLGQQHSDWLVAGQLNMNNTLATTARSLWTADGAIRKFELRGSVKSQRSSLQLGYLFTPADRDEERGENVREITLSANSQVSARWKGSISARYDAASSKLSQSGLGLVYRNECLQMNFSLSRSFATSTTVDYTQEIGFSLEFLGFGGQSAGGAAQQCRG